MNVLMREMSHTKIVSLLLFSIICLGTWLRFAGVQTGLDQPWWVDERYYDRYALEIAARVGLGRAVIFGWPNPQAYGIVLDFVYGFRYLLGLVTGQFHSLSDFLVQFAVQRSEFLLLARVVSAAFASLCIPVTYAVASHLFDSKVALTSALAVALCYPLIWYGPLNTPTSMGVSITLIALWGIISVWKRGRWRDYTWAGFSIGIATGTRVFPILLVVALVAAHYYRISSSSGNPFSAGWRARPMDIGTLPHLFRAVVTPAFLWSLAVIVIGTLVSFPSLVLDTRQVLSTMQSLNSYGNSYGFWQSIQVIFINQSFYWSQIDPEYVSFQANSLRMMSDSMLLWMTVGSVYGAIRFPRQFIVLCLYGLIFLLYFLTRGMVGVGVRQLLFILPSFLILASAAVWDALGRLGRLGRIRHIISVGILVLLFAQPIAWAGTLLDLFGRPTTLNSAAIWLTQNVPVDSVLAIDDYSSPFRDYLGKDGWDDSSGTLTPDQIREVHRAFLAYRPPWKIIPLWTPPIDSSHVQDMQLALAQADYVVTNSFASGTWQADTLLAWGRIGTGWEAAAHPMRMQYERLQADWRLVAVFNPRISRSMGPLVQVWQRSQP